MHEVADSVTSAICIDIGYEAKDFHAGRRLLSIVT